jgi:hypothetical protein
VRKENASRRKRRPKKDLTDHKANQRLSQIRQTSEDVLISVQKQGKNYFKVLKGFAN